MEKYIKSYTKLFCDALSENRIPDAEDSARAYARRLKEMYSSEDFRSFNIYPTIDTYKVFAVIAMCLELSEYSFSDEKIIDFINKVFRRLKRLFGALEKIIDSLPCCYAVAKRWNLSDHANRVKDGSITYDTFTVEDDRIEYRISKCMYVEMFTHYGIRRLCKVFCISDEQAYSNLTRHIKFIRHSDLSDGGSCHDEIIRVK